MVRYEWELTYSAMIEVGMDVDVEVEVGCVQQLATRRKRDRVKTKE